MEGRFCGNCLVRHTIHQFLVDFSLELMNFIGNINNFNKNINKIDFTY